jgi:3-hydroxyacyl-[acyl-carrier-protein] dehydratase
VSSQSYAAPLRAVEEVVVDPDGTSAAGRKRVTRTDPYLAGHYPDFTIYPGVFQLESVVQTARELIEARHAGARARLVRIRSLRFTAPLLDGDELSIALTLSDDLVAKAKCTRGDGTAAASMILEFAL